MSTQKVDLALHVAGEALKVVSCRLSEGISQLSQATIEVSSPDDIDTSALMLGDASLSLTLDGAPARTWSMIAGSARFVGVVHGSLRYSLSLHPRLWRTRLVTNTRKFRNLSAEQIIAQVLTEQRVPHAWRITRPTAVRKYCVQYRETTLDFVLRLLEFEGIFYWFSPEDVLVMADQSSASERAPGASYFELIDAAGALDREALGIHAFKRGARVAPGAATVNDFNWKKPKTNLCATAKADRDEELEIYDYPTGYRKPEQGEVLAALRLEAHRVPARFAEGKSNVPAFAPARLFDFGARPDPRFAGEYLLVRVDHRVDMPAHMEAATDELHAGATYENDFQAIPSAVPFRPALVTPYPHISGAHTAMVRGPAGEEIHTDKYGRFRAQFHWDREAVGTDDDSRWLRILQESATSMSLARVGWEMSVAYIDGDPDRPVGLSRHINGVMTPAYAQPANKNRMTIKTPTSPATGGFNELRLDDSAGAQHFNWQAEKDWIGDVVNDRTETVGNDEMHTVGTVYNHSVEHDQKVSIGGNYKVSAEGQSPVTVTKDRTRTVSGDETVEVGEVHNASTKGNETETVGGDRKTKAGDDNGSISRIAEKKLGRTVSASSITTGTGAIQTMVGDAYTESVTGAKMTVAKEGNIAQTVNGKLKVTVGGSAYRMATKDMGFGAQNAKVDVTAAASLTSAERVAVQGNHIVIEGKAAVSFKSQALEIEMTPAATTFKGQIRLESGSAIVLTGSPDNLTKG